MKALKPFLNLRNGSVEWLNQLVPQMLKESSLHVKQAWDQAS